MRFGQFHTFNLARKLTLQQICACVALHIVEHWRGNRLAACLSRRLLAWPCAKESSWATSFEMSIKVGNFRRRAEYGFGEYGSNTELREFLLPSPSSVERTQWVSLSLWFVRQNELTEFFAELTEFAAELSEAQWDLSSETVLSKQYSTRS